jgi:hypothetical protein
MKKPTRELDLDEAEAGMELACDLIDQHGTVLLQEGSVLTERLLGALARRGIARLRVVGEAAAGAADEGDRAAERARVEQRLAHLFRRAAGAGTAQLQACLLDYRLESLR